MIPDLVKIGYVVNVASGVIIDRQELESTGQRLGIKAVAAEVRSPNDLDATFQAMANDHVQAVIVLVDGMLFSERSRIACSRRPRDYRRSMASAIMSTREGWPATGSICRRIFIARRLM